MWVITFTGYNKAFTGFINVNASHENTGCAALSAGMNCIYFIGMEFLFNFRIKLYLYELYNTS